MKLNLKEIEKIETLELKNPQYWNETVEVNKGSLGEGVMKYAERWGKAMQYCMKQGMSLAEAAKETELECDEEGLSGNAFGFAVGILIRSWKYGEDLNKWFDLYHCPTNVTEDEDVLNN